MSPNKETDIQEKVKSLYEIMQEEKVEELKIKSPELQLHIRRKNYSKKQQQQTPAVTKNDDVAPAADNNDPEISENTVKSPITGVFYRSPSPTSPMFVNEGDVVETGKTLCLIEAMKVMNEIKSSEKAKIVKILIENGKSVTSGQNLFVIEKL